MGLYEHISDNPGIMAGDLHKWAAARVSFLPRLRCSFALWLLKHAGQIIYVTGKGGRYYYPADRGGWKGTRWTDDDIMKRVRSESPAPRSSFESQNLNY